MYEVTMPKMGMAMEDGEVVDSYLGYEKQP